MSEQTLVGVVGFVGCFTCATRKCQVTNLSTCWNPSHKSHDRHSELSSSRSLCQPKSLTRHSIPLLDSQEGGSFSGMLESAAAEREKQLAMDF